MPPGAVQDRFKADFIVMLEARFPIFFTDSECIGAVFLGEQGGSRAKGACEVHPDRHKSENPSNKSTTLPKKNWISQSYQISKISRDSRDARESRVQRVRGFQGCQDSRDSRDAKDSMAKMGNSHRIDPDPSKMHVRPTKIIRIKFWIDVKR